MFFFCSIMFLLSAPVSFDRFPVSVLFENLHMCWCQACKVKVAKIYVILLDSFPLHPDTSEVFQAVICWLRCINWNHFAFLITFTLPGIEMKYQIIQWGPFHFPKELFTSCIFVDGVVDDDYSWWVLL